MDRARLRPLENFMCGAPDDVRYVFEELLAERSRVDPVRVAALAVLTTVESCDKCGVCSDRAGAVIDIAKEAGL